MRLSEGADEAVSLSASEIGLVTEQLKKDLLGAAVREVLSEREEGRITLRMWANGADHYVRIVLNTGVTRLGRIDRKPKSAPTPHPFVMLLRREIVGLRLTDVVWMNHDRVVRFDFRRDERRCAVVAELVSQHANLFWIDDAGVIGGAFHQHRSQHRGLFPGERYTPPLSFPAIGKTNRFAKAASPEAEIDAVYEEKERVSGTDQQRILLLKMVRTIRRRTERLIEKLETDLLRAESGETLRLQAHVLKAHLRDVPRGASRFETADFSGNPIVITLDPKLPAPANMDRMFQKAKRFSQAVSKIEDRLLQAMSDLERIETTEIEIAEASPEALHLTQHRLEKQYPFLKRVALGKKRPPMERLPYREYLIAPNRIARVGRSARDNDTLTLRHASPQDLWLHVRGETGSHVVVPMGKKEELQPETLIDAAHLAAHFSKLKNDGDVEVIYTRRRYVQKPKGAPPGSVRLLREKTLSLQVEPERLTRILKSNDTASGC